MMDYRTPLSVQTLIDVLRGGDRERQRKVADELAAGRSVSNAAYTTPSVVADGAGQRFPYRRG